MNRQGHDETTNYFIGPEVEQTPAFSKRTLFVIGKQDVAEIEQMAREYKTPHIFMGANHSFEVDPKDMTFYWRDTITSLLDKGFWVTLDYPAHQHESVLKMFTPGVWQCRTFVPLLSVRIPNIETSSPNLTVKIDDIDFNATNPGVWCLHYHQLTDSNRFTGWGEYGTDEVVSASRSATPKVAAPVKVKAAEVVAPVVTPEVTVAALNDSMLGLDTDPTSALKPDTEAVVVPVANVTTEEALAAYAEGAKVDPLGTEASKKPVKKSKAV